MKPYRIRRKTTVCGGHDSWLKALRPMLSGPVRYVGREQVFDPRAIRGSDVVWVQLNAISHANYARVRKYAALYGKSVRFFSCAGASRCAQELAQYDRGGDKHG